MNNEHHDQLQSALARASALSASAGAGNHALTTALGILEQRINDHQDPRINIATDTRTQNDKAPGPETRHGHPRHETQGSQTPLVTTDNKQADPRVQTTHLDQLQLDMAKATGLMANTNTGTSTLRAIIAKLEGHILEHPDNRLDVATRMRPQRGITLDPEALLAYSGHGNLRTLVLHKPNGGQRIIHAPDDRDCANGLLHLTALTPAAESTASHLDHGFRPMDRITTPVKQLIHAIKEGYVHIAQLDVENCFHHLPIAESFTRLVPPRTAALIHALHHAWNKAEHTRTEHGLPQGHPLSPAYSNIVLNLIMARARAICGSTVIIVRYADDITILSKGVNDLRHAIEMVTLSLAEHGMAINEDKTSVTVWKSGAHIDYLGYLMEPAASGINIAPKPGAYANLRDKLVNTTDSGQQRMIITAWFSAFALTNKNGENTRAIDYIKSLQALRLHPRFLPAPMWGANPHDTSPLACQSRFLDQLAMMVAERKARSCPPSPPAFTACTSRLSDGGPSRIGPPTSAHTPGQVHPIPPPPI
jgi:hypothetical protein